MKYFLSLGLSVTLAFLPCSPAGAAPLRLAVSDGPVSLPVYVAESQGLFQREGVDLKLLPCASGRACMQMLDSGQAELATAAELVVVLAAIAHSDAAIVATLGASVHHLKLVARRGAGIARVEDLRGKRVATVAGSSAQYFLDSCLLVHGMEPDEITLAAMKPDEMVRALGQGQVDAVAIWEPAASDAIAALGAEALVLPTPRVYTQHFSLVASRAVLSGHENELLRVLRALLRAQALITDQPHLAAKILAARLPAADARIDLSEHDFRLSLSQSLVSTMEGEARWAQRQGHGKPDRSVLKSIAAGPLRRVAPQAVELVD